MSTAHLNVLVTGASQGIGLEVVRQLAARGCAVWLSSRDASRGSKAAASVSGDVRFLELDVTRQESVEQAVRQISTLDVLVNNAAILIDSDEGDVLDLRAEVLRETIETNAIAPLRLAQAFMPLLRRSESPRIINVSSGGGQLSDPSTWAPAYCISKTMLNAVTVQLAGTLPDFCVNAVCPGWVRTEMGGSAAPRSVEEGADTIVWLALDAPGDVTGRFLRDRQVIPW